MLHLAHDVVDAWCERRGHHVRRHGLAERLAQHAAPLREKVRQTGRQALAEAAVEPRGGNVGTVGVPMRIGKLGEQSRILPGGAGQEVDVLRSQRAE